MTIAAAPSTDTQLEDLSKDECRTRLGHGTVGRIAFVVEGLPVVLPVNYRFLDDDSGLWILLRTRPGNVIDAAPEHVAFEIDGVDHAHQLGWSVLVGGVLHRLDHNEIELMTKRFDPKPWVRQDRASWLAIKPTTITGRRLKAAANEWAFASEAYL